MSIELPRRTIDWKERDPGFRSAVREAFAGQKAMALIGASLTAVEPGFVEIRLPFRDELTQQHGALHGGVVGMIVDAACAFAAATLFPPGATGSSVEYKVNFLAPARGETVIARGWVVRPGRTVTVAIGEAYSVSDGREQLVATMLESILQFSTTGERPA
jgi:uncharacterized protein (TIGR00369 family)